MFGYGDRMDKKIAARREMVFIILTGLFLGTLAMLNILGISRQIDLSFNIGTLRIPFVVFVGVLPYPLTFLCTDLITYFFTNAISITPGVTVAHGLLVLIFSNYMFKMVAALVDTLPFYVGTRWLTRYLEIDPNENI